jgi:hypothetical protein
MNTKTATLLCAAATLLGFAPSDAGASTPTNFPGIVVSNYMPGSVSPGYIFLAVATETPGIGTYLMILDNDGTPVWYEESPSQEVYDFKALPNGYLSCAPFIEGHTYSDGGDATHEIRNDSYALVETVTGGNGYVADSHDFMMLPNGHAVQFGYYMSEVDVSAFLAGGHPAALISGGVLQELDAQRNVVFQWRTWDHYRFEDLVTSTNAVIDMFHLNALEQDSDGNFIWATPSEIKKIDRQTGDIVWRLGGTENEFALAGAGADVSHFGGHAFNRLTNGNWLIYDNGPLQGAGTSTVREYSLDQSNKVATLVWSYIPPEDIQAWHGGNAQRLPNGNTFIGWGGAGGGAHIPACTEVNMASQKVFELWFATNSPQVESYRAFRYPYPPATQRMEIVVYEVAQGNDYDFTNTTHDTGISIEIDSLSAEVYNDLTVTREPYAPVYPSFSGKAPRVLPVRVAVDQAGITDISGTMSFAVSKFDFGNPSNITVNYRATPGAGLFVPLPTAYNWVIHELQAPLYFGEYIFCFSDVGDVPHPPMLNEVESYRGTQTAMVVAARLAATGVTYQVNQALPVALTWSPKGFARWYELEISTNEDFSTTEVDVPYQTEAYYVWASAAPDTLYHYRVKTQNEGGESAWSAGSFQTVEPSIEVSAPNGGEAWTRGQSYFIQWDDNVGEDVVIDLYKGGAFLQGIATSPSSGAYEWEIPSGLDLGDDYAVRIGSATNGALFDASDLNFSIVDLVSVTIDTVPAGLTVEVDGTNTAAPAIFAWTSGSPHSVGAVSPQDAGDSHTRYAFASWSDGGAQSHSIAAPATAATFTASFTTQYLLETAVAPAGAGSISNAPAGPWYDAGQLVSLTARTNAGYRLGFWQGTDTAASNTAQVTMEGYRLVQANFMPATYPYLEVTNSGGAAPGQLIGNIGGRTAAGTRLTYVILDNTGTNILFSSTNQALWRFVSPQGFDAVATGGVFGLKDETFNVVDAATTLGYTLDTHDIEVWPNGHTLVFAQEFQTVDMSQLVPGGNTAANITGNVIQELDADNRLVFEWHTFDHIAITNTFADMTQASFDYAHVNCVTIDPTDNNLIASLRTTCEIVKIDRRTGQVLWRLGGRMNQFTYIGEHPENDPYYTVGQHDVHRLANGNLLFFDNGNISGGGTTPNDRTYSRAVEYALDEVSMTATMVWEYRHTPDIKANCTGSLKRMPNGNTFIDWGCAVPVSGYIVTEVSPAGELVFEMRHSTTGGISSVLLGGGLTKQFWNSPELIRSASYEDVQAGQTYTSAEAGVSVTITNLTGPADNTLMVQRHLDAVRFPQFSGKAPQVTMEHIVISATNITSLQAELSLSLPDTNYVYDAAVVRDPTNVVVYQRPTPGQGQFSALPTSYDAGANTLRLTATQLGEFIFAMPDVDETPYVPQIVSPADQSEINQAAPITLTWKPQGLVGSFDLQAATDAGFASLALDTSGWGSNTYVLANAIPNTQYYWRVRTVNQGGTSDWASASFATVPPVLDVTYPAGGEVWQRFQVVDISWVDNIDENVSLELWKGGVYDRRFSASTPSDGSFTWTVGQFQAIPFATDYTVRIASVTDTNFFDFSEPFSIISNLTGVTIATVPPGLTVAVDGTNYTSPAVFSWLPSSSHSVGTDSPQVTDDGHSRHFFASWSDGGSQSHSMIAPFTATTNTAAFSTQYLLDIAVTPTNGGTVMPAPGGDWYDDGQVVSLTAAAAEGYRLYSWSGVDMQASNTAQVTMSEYRSVSATFLEKNFPVLVVTNTPAAAPGVLIGVLGGKGTATNIYYAILENSGYPLFYSPTQTLSDFVAPNGFIAVPSDTANTFDLKDESFSVVDSFTFGGDYNLDGHDFKLLCNGHALLMASETRQVDMSQIVPGGRPDALVDGAVIQEIDAGKNVLFQWRTLDHIPITDSLNVLTGQSIDFDHINSFTIDPLDNNYLVSMRGLCQLIKISRTTGEIIWRLGGKHSDFTFVGEHPENAPYYFVGQHSVHRLINGNLVFFDNGRGLGTLGNRSYTRAVEYHLDETNMTATLVWDYRHVPDIVSPSGGTVQRFANGNTLVGWFSSTRQGVGPFITEVSSNNAVVLEMAAPGFRGQCELTKKIWNSPDLIRSTAFSNIVAGNAYVATNAGVSVTVNSLAGSPTNELVARRHLDAVRFPQFPGKAPQVLVERVTLSGSGIDSLDAGLSLQLPDNSFCFDTPIFRDPAQLTVYRRATIGSGVFTALATTYDATNGTLEVQTSELGEFIFTYPDLPEVALAPLLYQPEDLAGVNQEEPVRMQWTPRGFARSYHLQVATDAGFSNLAVDAAGLAQMDYTLPTVLPNTQYWWRVNVTNDGGESAWSESSFQTVPPAIAVTVPDGGGAWLRGLKYFIQWDDNIAGDVVIELYKGGVLSQVIATNASSGAYQWEVGLGLDPGFDYTIRIKSATDGALFGESSAAFSIIDEPSIDAVAQAPSAGEQVQILLTAPGAAHTAVIISTNFVTWEELQTVPLTNGSAVFTDGAASNFPFRAYRIRVP